MEPTPIYREESLEYKFFPITKFRKSFKIKAQHDAHICLNSTGEINSKPLVEIFLGGWSNQKSAIRLNQEKPDKAVAETPDLLNGDEWREFILEWSTTGDINVYLERATQAFLSWKNPEPFAINYFGIATHWQGSGEWIIEGKADEPITTSDSMESHEYQFFPIDSQSGRLEFKVKAKSNAHLALTAGPTEEVPMHEVFIGGWDNGKSAIRANREKPDKAFVETPDILHPDEFRHFWIEWNPSSIKVGHQGSEVPFMSYESRESHEIKHFGIRSYYGSDSNWIIFPAGEPGSNGDAGIVIESGSIILDSPGGDAPSAPPMHDSAEATRTKREGNIGEMHWVQSSGGQVPEGALLAGKDGEQDLFVGRASHEGDLIPGKLLPSHSVVYVPWGGREHGKPEYEVLVVSPETVKWVQLNAGDPIPEIAIPGGQTASGETLYIGRREHEGSVTNGKVHPSHGSLYIAYGGQEIGFPDYEILVKN